MAQLVFLLTRQPKRRKKLVLRVRRKILFISKKIIVEVMFDNYRADEELSNAVSIHTTEERFGGLFSTLV